MSYITDPTLGLNHQARAVLHALSGIEAPEGLHLITTAWYNGRECGFVIEADRWDGGQQALFVVVVEGRNHDGLCVDVWEGPSHLLNPVTFRDAAYERAYEGRRSFDCLDVRKAVDYVEAALVSFSLKMKR